MELRRRPKWQPIRRLAPILLLIGLGVAVAYLPLPTSVLVIAVAAVALAFWQPLAGVVAVMAIAPFGALEEATYGARLLDSGQLALFIIFAIWLARGAVKRRIWFPSSPLNLPLLLFIVVAALSLIGAVDLRAGLVELIKWVEIWLLMLMVRDLAIDEPNTSSQESWRRWKLDLLLGGIIFAGLVQAALGIYQFALRGDGPEHFMVLGQYYRAYGGFEQPNPYGGFISLITLLAAGLLLAAGARALGQPDQPITWPAIGARIKSIGWRSWLLMVGLILAVTLLGAALIASWSRGAWLGFAFGALAMTLLLPRKLRHGVALLTVTIAIGVAAFSAGLVPETVSSRLLSAGEDFQLTDVRGVDINDSNFAVVERLAHWQSAVDMARSKPWLGVGIGNFDAAYGDFALLNWPDSLGHAHNYYLNILAETGFLGLSAYLILWGVILWQTLKLLKNGSWPYRGIALGLLGAWVALTAHHAVDKLYVNNVYIHLGVMLGVLQALGARND